MKEWRKKTWWTRWTRWNKREMYIYSAPPRCTLKPRFFWSRKVWRVLCGFISHVIQSAEIARGLKNPSYRRHAHGTGTQYLFPGLQYTRETSVLCLYCKTLPVFGMIYHYTPFGPSDTTLTFQKIFSEKFSPVIKIVLWNFFLIFLFSFFCPVLLQQFADIAHLFAPQSL